MFVKSIRLRDLQNEEHFRYHSYVDEVIDELTATLLKVEPQFADFKLKLAVERAALNQIQKSSFTAKVDAADVARDKPIRGFFKVVKGMLHHYNPTIAEAAYRVNLVNEKFSDITRLSNEKQTAATVSYLDALQTVSADIETMFQTGWVTEIDDTNKAFVALQNSRLGEKDVDTSPNMKESRHDLDAAYNAIIHRINAFITIDGDAQYAAFVTKINNRIDIFALALAQRAGRSKKDAEDAAKNK